MSEGPQFRINVNWHPEENFKPQWETMLKDEYLAQWGADQSDWDEMRAAGAIRRIHDRETQPVLPTDIEEMVRADIAARRDFGRVKYGTSMERKDLSLRDWLWHAYEESLDFPIYLRRAIREIDEKEAGR